MQKERRMITLPPLPYALDALEPQISRETLEYHYGKHHQAYVTNLNNLLPGSGFEGADLESIIQNSSGPIFNNAAQVWNHSFYWQCLSPTPSEPTGALLQALNTRFGSVADFQAQFTKVALATFGSGWAWLCKTDTDQLEIISTSNAATPLSHPTQKPLLTCDVWEHAYYIDYRNARATYIEAFWKRVNWAFVADCFLA